MQRQDPANFNWKSQDNLHHQLQGILNNIKEIQKSLDLSKLEPANLKWESFLKNMPTLSVYFQDIVKQISLLKYYVVYPTKPESPDQKISIDDLLSSNDISELNSEKETCKQRYQEVIKQIGFENSSAKERKANLENQIYDHNKVCENADKMAKEIIDAKKLTVKNTIYIQTAKVRPPPFTSLAAMANGCDALPVPQNLKSRQ